MPAQHASALTAPALVGLAMLALLLVAERVGLPTGWVRLFFLGIVLCALASLMWLSRTAQERAFLGQVSALGAVAGGVVLAMAATAVITLLSPPATDQQWLAGIIGVTAGLLLAHAITRMANRAHAPETGGIPTAFSTTWSLLRGLGLVLAGGTLALAGTEAARTEVARLLTMATSVSSAQPTMQTQAVLLLALVAVLFGGARTSLLQAAALSLAALAAIGLTLLIGLVYLGPLPLPGQSETATLAAIAEARQRWGITLPLHLMDWPNWTLPFQGDGLKMLGISAVVSAGIGLALSPVIPVRRKSTLAVATLVCLLLPIAVIAIGGYAIEAAASAFVGASIARPPAALVETARLGLVGICGAQPESAEALRLACGVSPRDTAVLAWDKISLTPAYIHTGMSAAVGFSTTLNLSTGLLSAAWHLLLVTLGLGLAAQGLGLHILARNHHAAGLASLRLGLVRLSALIIAAALALMPGDWLAMTRTAQLPAFVAGTLVLLVFWLWVALRKQAPLAIEQTASPRTRRTKSAALANSEAA
jgi:hypothetical protein